MPNNKGEKPLIQLENVCFSYDKNIDVIKNVSLSIFKGEHIAIIGHNGSGKSTLAKLFNGLVKADSGSVRVMDFDCNDKKQVFEVRKRVGVVFQNPDNQLIASIVEDDIAFGPENLGVDRKEIAKRIDFALKSVGMEKYRHSSPTRLSGGQKQRIAIAGVLALKPSVLVLDESTAMLDPQGRNEVLSVAKALNKEQGTTVINITHYMDEVVGADRVFVMNKGEIVLCGTPQEIFNGREKIAQFGLELPLSTTIADELKQVGFDVGSDVLTEQQLFDAINKRLEGLCK